LWRQARVWWQRILQLGRRAPRRLRLCESLPLGERRFVAVVEFEQTRFLLGGTSASLVLLARLESPPCPVLPSPGPTTNPMSGEEQR
jgi:flagellar biogenesis protein FliO